MPTSFQLTLLHPYLAYLKSNIDEDDNNCLFGFADTQNAICTAFVYDTIPYMKTIERMTNPCFQEAPFASVMKGRHVLNEPDEADLDSDHVEEFSGQAKGGDREREVTRKRKRKDPPLQSSGDGPTQIEGGVLDQMQMQVLILRVTEVILNLFLQSDLVHSFHSHMINQHWELIY